MEILTAPIFEILSKDTRTGLALSQKIATDTNALTSMLKSQADSTLSTTFSNREVVADKAIDIIFESASILTKLGIDQSGISNLIRKKLSDLAEQTHKSTISKYPFEIHITVEIPKGGDLAKYIDKFSEVCRDTNVKPIMLDLSNQSNVFVMNDATTSSKMFGTEDESRHEVERISSSLEANGFHVIRKKIETAVWHEDAMREKLKDGHYFECHVSLFIPSANKEERMAELSSLCKIHSAHLSRNLMKREADGRFVQMATIRTYSSPDPIKISHRKFFEEKIDELAKDLTRNGFEYEKLIYEFALFDTRNNHDKAWLEAKPLS
jgi:hypothetical protein